MVRNIKIKSLLILSFAVVLLLMNASGVMSVFFTNMLANKTMEFYERPHKVQTEVLEIQNIMVGIGSQIKEALLYKTEDKTNETTQYISNALDDMNRRILIVKERYLGDQSLLDSADQKVVVWLEENSKLKTAMEAEKFEEAAQVFLNDYLPAEKELMKAVSLIKESSADRTENYYTTAKQSKTVALIVILTANAIAVVLTVYLCTVIIRSITIPLKKIKEASDAMNRGVLNHDIDYSGNNEFGKVAESMKGTMDTLSTYVNDINSVLGRISDYDLHVSVDIEYIGDFTAIKSSMEKIIASLKRMITQIGLSSVQVDSGAGQISASSQTLSQGSSEQAASIEELTSRLNEISEQVLLNAKYTESAHELVESVGSRLEMGNRQMSEMLNAISEINSAADQIAKIIKAIEDIAFQTNILALNAAVEAARAGAAGKGFAVVADEVRNLAGKSAEAASSTTELIQNAIKAVENGTSIAGSTADTLNSVVEGASQITEMVSRIAESSDDQADSLSKITAGINQLNEVVQTNAATAEESAGTSEELSAQARILKNLVSAFKIGENY